VRFPTVFVHQAQISEAVAQARNILDPREVRDVRFTLGQDAGGEPAIFFGILLTPQASHPAKIGMVTGRVATTLLDELQPYNSWGLQPYFNFTSDPLNFQNPAWM
jgi:hypothetical protein